MLIPLSGWLSDRFGARWVYLAAIAVFTLASAGCAVAGSPVRQRRLLVPVAEAVRLPARRARK